MLQIAGRSTGVSSGRSQDRCIRVLSRLRTNSRRVFSNPLLPKSDTWFLLPRCRGPPSVTQSFFALEITERDSFRLLKMICSLDWSQVHIRTPMTEAYQPRVNMRRREAQAYRTLNLVSSGRFGFLLFVMD